MKPEKCIHKYLKFYHDNCFLTGIIPKNKKSKKILMNPQIMKQYISQYHKTIYEYRTTTKGVIVARFYDNWLRTGRYRVRSIPGLGKIFDTWIWLINHFHETIASVKIDCFAETWLGLSLPSFIQIYKKNRVTIYKTQLFVKMNRCKVNTILNHVI